MERKLTTILAADVVGYSRLMENDEAGTFDRLQAHRRELFEPEIVKHHGRIFKLMGDGLLAEFGSVVEAVECAVALQRGLAERNADVSEDKRIETRIGINLGEVIVEGGDRFGEGVNIAARLQQLAEPGGICVSGKVSKEVEKKLAFRFEPMGEKRMKNITELIACYRLNLQRPVTAKTDLLLPTGLPKRATIAVLPFINMSGDPEQEFFSDGITEDIITDLSKISGLHVVARNTVFAYKGKPNKVQQMAQELGVRFVLEGSVRKAGPRVRVTGQLVDGEDGSHVWADRYDRELVDIFAIQDEITHAIVNQLKVKLLPEEKKAIETAPTENIEAYTYYLRGRQFSHTWSKNYVLLARRMFSKAVELDPLYARAYAGIANCDSLLRSWHQITDVSVAGILEMSAKALALDPNLPEAHASRGLALQFVGRHDEAVVEFEHALVLDPDLYEANFFYAGFCFAKGNFERAANLFERAAHIRPDAYNAPVLLCAVYRALGLEAERERSARVGLERAEREINLHPENSGPAQMGALALAHLGEYDRAKDWAARTLAIDPDDLLAQYNIAAVYSQLGELDLAIDLLEKVLPLEEVGWFENDTDFDPIRSHSRYPKLLDTIGTRRAQTTR